jgi:hypothetical protein
MNRSRPLRSLLFAPFLLLAFASAHALADSPFRLDLEAGAVWQERNDFAVPGTTGTLVTLAPYDKGPWAAFRGTLTWDAGERWSLRFVAAPLSTTTTFKPASPVDFQGQVFAAGEPLTVDYRFNSYRATWYYRFPSSGSVSFRGGLTANVRDARIGLTNPQLSSAKANVGFVPLLYGGVRWQATERLALDLEAEGLAAPQGRAGDVALRGEWALSRRVSLSAGVRLLEGGADNDEVYNFATFVYAIGGVSVRF